MSYMTYFFPYNFFYCIRLNRRYLFNNIKIKRLEAHNYDRTADYINLKDASCHAFASLLFLFSFSVILASVLIS